MDIIDIITKIILFGPPVLFSIVLHEVAHGYAAYLYGDSTAKRQGRLSLNPIKHIDPIGTVLLPLILIVSGSGMLFGWAKPVPVNILLTRNPKRAMGLVALAGPMTNLTLAFIALISIKMFGLHDEVFRYLEHLFRGAPLGDVGFLSRIMVVLMIVNVVLAVFNLIPIPPLDGGRVAVWLLPKEQARAYAKIEPYGMFIIFALIIFNPFGILGKLIGGVLNFFIRLI